MLDMNRSVSFLTQQSERQLACVLWSSVKNILSSDSPKGNRSFGSEMNPKLDFASLTVFESPRVKPLYLSRLLTDLAEICTVCSLHENLPFFVHKLCNYLKITLPLSKVHARIMQRKNEKSLRSE